MKSRHAMPHGAWSRWLVLLAAGWAGLWAAGDPAGAFGFWRRRGRAEGERPRVTFDDVAGAGEAKAALEGVVEFLGRAGSAPAGGARRPGGVVLLGPPGAGKTLLAQAVAGETGSLFYYISAWELVGLPVGVGADYLRDPFEQAKESAPAIIFIDDLDALGRRRAAGPSAVGDARAQALDRLLAEMDRLGERQGLAVLAATSRPDELAPALLWPGRFHRLVVVGLPDRQTRESILRLHTREMTLAADVDLALLAGTTTGFGGADLAKLCEEAARLAAGHGHDRVTVADFGEALDSLVLGGVHPLLLDPHERRVVAQHEAGHAVVAWLTPGARAGRGLTILPRARAPEAIEPLPGEEHPDDSLAALLARLDVCLGGPIAEVLAFGEASAEARNDLAEATRLARRIATRWGAGRPARPAFEPGEEQGSPSPERRPGRSRSPAGAAQLEREVQRLLAERSQAVRRLLMRSRQPLDRLVERLVREETVDEAMLASALRAPARP